MISIVAAFYCGWLYGKGVVWWKSLAVMVLSVSSYVEGYYSGKKAAE